MTRFHRSWPRRADGSSAQCFHENQALRYAGGKQKSFPQRLIGLWSVFCLIRGEFHKVFSDTEEPTKNSRETGV